MRHRRPVRWKLHWETIIATDSYMYVMNEAASARSIANTLALELGEFKILIRFNLSILVFTDARFHSIMLEPFRLMIKKSRVLNVNMMTVSSNVRAYFWIEAQL